MAFGPFTPPRAYMTCGLWDQLGPFWPNYNEAKRWQGGSPPEPKLRPELAQGPRNPRLAIKTDGPQYSKNGLWQPPEAISSGPEKFPLISKGDRFLSYGCFTAVTRNVAYMVLYTIMQYFST
ncbi:hypothetical protein O181_007591 [Austropuccinia psidii MF-1]|uniref:Uncharacterized protein n=1 Tax=Austropuccinia psidii MF-1 TaxID=1389203 RepID=A0A9Q3GHR3_9BASI|nr:hypothetical protein [Austropuccinia psidii MF-1]